MAAIDFPNPPLTVGQNFSAPNGFVYQWDGAVWTAAPGVNGTAAGGDLVGSYPNPQVAQSTVGSFKIPGLTAGADISQLLLGTTTAKSRIAVEPAAACLGRLDIMANAKVSATSTWLSDDTTKPSWLFAMDPTGDILGVWRAPATTGVPALANLLSLDNGGNATLAAGLVTGSNVVVGPPGGTRARLDNDVGNHITYLYQNLCWAPDVMSVPSWTFWMGYGDTARISRRPANAAAGSGSDLLYITNDGITHCTLPKNYVYAGVPGSNPPSSAAWSKIMDIGTLNTRGGTVLICGYWNYDYFGNNNQNTVYIGLGINNGVYQYVRNDFSATGTGFCRFAIPCPVFMDNRGAGSYLYSIYIYTANTNGSPITAANDAPGQWQAIELN